MKRMWAIEIVDRESGRHAASIVDGDTEEPHFVLVKDRFAEAREARQEVEASMVAHPPASGLEVVLWEL